ncbi:hypothetical protein HY732_01410, partial [Candidatus Uhrbacteria bacterium]|nr:hypothetical protein [Candidatus Uhrbacteria bacterium]
GSGTGDSSSGIIPPGGACTLNTQCTTGLCVNGQCTQNNPPGTPCTQQYECSSNRCVNGVCAAPLPPPGGGAIPPGGACTLNTQCTTNQCTNGTCQYPDSDNDGLPDNVDPNPNNPDTDGDGLLDGQEDRNRNGRVDHGETDPTNPDTDHDGLLDGQEDKNKNGIVDPGETNPLDSDTDGDGLLDGVDPYPLDTTRPGRSTTTDTDGDGVPDAIEIKTNTNPNNPDTDGDGRLDGQEDRNRNGRVDKGETDPRKADSDGNGVNDGDQCSVIRATAGLRTSGFLLNTIFGFAIRMFADPVFADETNKVYSKFSDTSDDIVIEGGAGTEALNPPGDVVVSAVTAPYPRLQITWTDMNAGSANYHIERRATNAPDENTFSFLTSNGSSPYNDPASAPSPLYYATSYTYKICATKSGVSSQCVLAQGSTAGAPTEVSPITTLKIYRSSDSVTVLASDAFMCLRNDCEDDSNADVQGNQHRYAAVLEDTGGVVSPTAGITWEWKIEGNGTSYLQGPTTLLDAAGKPIADVREVTARSTNTGAALVVKASQMDGDKVVATLERRIPLSVAACDYTWPASMQQTYAPYTNDQLDFSMWYCRGAGAESTVLPMLGSPIPLSRRQENRIFDYEYIIPLDTSDAGVHLGSETGNKNIRSDVVVMRVARVPSSRRTYSVATWYKNTFNATPSPHEPVNGYPAVQDANGVYVLAYDTTVSGTLNNVLRGVNENDAFGSTVYYFTTNTGASPATRGILNGLLGTVVFSKNVGYDASLTGGGTAGRQLRRDIQRMVDMESVGTALDRAPTLPRIDAGSFVKHTSISAWQTSWRDLGGLITLSPLPDDPALAELDVRHFSGVGQCREADGYESSTCWNKTSRHFGAVSGASAFADDVEKAVNATGVYAYSYKFFPPAGVGDLLKAQFCARTELLKISANLTTRYLACRPHFRNQDNALLKATGVACTGSVECATGTCEAGRCANSVPQATFSIPPRINSATHNSANLQGQTFQKNWDGKQDKTIQISADDPDGTVAHIESTIGSFAFDGNSFDLNINALRLGDNILTVTAVDNYGVRVSKEFTFTVAERTPNTDPSLAITAPAGGSTIVRNTADMNVTLAFTASDPDTNNSADSSIARDAVARIHYTFGSLSGDVTSSSSTFSQEVSIRDLAAGIPYTLSATAYDTRGGSKTASVSTITIRDNSPPSFSNEQPTSGSAYTVGNDVTFSGRATDQDGVASVRLYKVQSNGSETPVALISNSENYSFAVVSADLPVGNHTYKIVATDQRGMPASYTVWVSIVRNGGWGAWGECTAACGPGATRTRLCNSPAPENGGLACETLSPPARALTETRDCGPCPSWSAEWSQCTMLCGTTGIQSKTCIDPNTSDAATGQCSDPTTAIGGTKEQDCNRFACVPPQWSAWSPATCPACGTNVTQTRTCILGNDGSTSCGSGDATRACAIPACTPATWSVSWTSTTAFTYTDGAGGTCSADCNSGRQKRTCNAGTDPTSRCSYEEAGEYDEEGNLMLETIFVSPGTVQEQSCNKGACPVWEVMSGCTEQCGSGGIQQIRCTVPANQTRTSCGTPPGTVISQQPNFTVIACNRVACPAWQDTTPCGGAQCGSGSKAQICAGTPGYGTCSGGSAVGSSRSGVACPLGACPSVSIGSFTARTFAENGSGNTAGEGPGSIVFSRADATSVEIWKYASPAFTNGSFVLRISGSENAFINLFDAYYELRALNALSTSFAYAFLGKDYYYRKQEWNTKNYNWPSDVCPFDSNDAALDYCPSNSTTYNCLDRTKPEWGCECHYRSITDWTWVCDSRCVEARSVVCHRSTTL